MWKLNKKQIPKEFRCEPYQKYVIVTYPEFPERLEDDHIQKQAKILNAITYLEKKFVPVPYPPIIDNTEYYKSFSDESRFVNKRPVIYLGTLRPNEPIPRRFLWSEIFE